ncbi:metal ABC transporter solute-binding protein, Zn/Mn family [Synechococcus sp. CBW1006]|uniref:metal ABC transporter solute-binding protein, Zn/Mn family n=1 Tax=Synechococcus sp. CBW1006 TaxID=1353138 RepID=UPI0018CF0AEF|nr:zinc ABC transporter substrate-binding protein [Synechococcus sp. CBW1006]QPN65618.1 zinc ABC transporter substrate-binding protein [Synechococcus sp. CBW1006]
MAPIHALLIRAGAISLSLLLAACGAPQQKVESSSSGAKLPVVTTFLPITLFTRAVAGDCATVTPLIPANTGPHEFQGRPSDLTALRQARVLVKNGLEMESFLDKLVASVGNSQLAVIDSSRGIATIDSPEGEAEHGHEHGSDHDQGSGHEHGEDKGHGHAHGAVNPHIWLDPLRAVQQVETIRDGLVKADPSCAEGYKRNAAAYINQLQKLNSDIAAQLKPYSGKTFIAFHDFAPYFAQRYGLKAEFLVDVPELNPSPADLQRVAAEVRTTQLKALLSEPQEGQRSFNTLAQDLGVKIVVFNPLETGSLDSVKDPGTYLQVMRQNAAGLIQAFGG